MKVLFVASGNKAVGTVSAFVRSQFDSLKAQDLEMVLYPIIGHGLKGYVKHVRSLRRVIKTERPDIIHAHYSVCGYLSKAASVGLKTKIVVSLLGSFPQKNLKLHLVRFCVDYFWNATIVKSERTRNQLNRNLPVIPNGVNLSQFNLMDHEAARQQLGFSADKKYVIFVSNPSRSEKNFALAEEAVQRLNNDTVQLVAVFDKPHDEVVKYMCAADMLILTSLKEGSPNVIKEAMSCNCPLVSTDVGDVKWVTDGVEGTYVASSFSSAELANLVDKALAFGGRTKGREQIIRLGLTTEAVAQRLMAVYSNVVEK